MSRKDKIEDLIGKELKGFSIIMMTEVFRTNDDGQDVGSIGYFKGRDIAVAFAGTQTDANFFKTRQALVLTNGTSGYLIENRDPVKLFDDEEELHEIKMKAVAKLTPTERKLLGL